MKLVKVALAATLLVASVGVANAVPYTWEDLWDPADFLIKSSSPDYNYIHDLRDGLNGFRPGIDTITSATLTIWLTDDQLCEGFLCLEDEEVRFRFDGSGWTRDYEVDFNDKFQFNVASFLTDGVLNVTVDGREGDFKFQKSHLKATGNRADAPRHVQEPATLSLMGLGLLGMAFGFRRRVR